MNSVQRGLFWFASTAIVTYAIFSDGKLDLLLSRLLYDPNARAFVWAKSEFVHQVLYIGHKWLMTFVAIVLMLWGMKAQRIQGSRFGREHLMVGVFGTVIIIAAVGVLKRLTGIECPWSIDEFGGEMRFISMQEVVRLAMTGQTGEGRCFPAGHSTGGLFLLAWAAAVHDMSRQASAWLVAAGVTLGLLMGLVRMAQGAHFLSHVIWATWVSGLIAYLLWAVKLRQNTNVLNSHHEISS